MRCVLAITALLLGGSGCGGGEHFTEPRRDAGPAKDAGGPDVCPEIALVIVAPLQTGVGGRGLLHAEAADAGTVVSFDWFGTAGVRVAMGHAADASYTCVTQGHQTLTLQARTTSECKATYQIGIICAK